MREALKAKDKSLKQNYQLRQHEILHKMCMCLSTVSVSCSGDFGKWFVFETTFLPGFLIPVCWVSDSRNNKNHLKSNVDLNLYGRQESSIKKEKKKKLPTYFCPSLPHLKV